MRILFNSTIIPQILIVSVCINLSLVPQAMSSESRVSESIYSFGNSGFSYLQSEKNYEYKYGKENEYNYRERKTGIDSNYYYAPKYSGQENCHRADRNYIYCGR